MKMIRISGLTAALLLAAAPLFSEMPGGSATARALAALTGKHPGSAASSTAPIVPVNPRFKQVRDKIAVLFHTDAPLSPVADPGSDPFRIGSAGAAPALDAAGPQTPEPASEPASGSPEEQLRQFVGRLRIGGVSVLNGVARVSIDGTPHRQGDFVKAGDPANPVWLQVARLTSGSVTFRFRDNTEPDGPSFTLRI